MEDCPQCKDIFEKKYICEIFKFPNIDPLVHRKYNLLNNLF